MTDSVANNKNWIAVAGVLLTIFLASIAGVQYFNNTRFESRECLAGIETKVERNSADIEVIKGWIADNKDMPKELARVADSLARIDKRTQRWEELFIQPRIERAR